jgi:hypothetical protein
VSLVGLTLVTVITHPSTHSLAKGESSGQIKKAGD